jgi:hypothetical protein
MKSYKILGISLLVLFIVFNIFSAWISFVVNKGYYLMNRANIIEACEEYIKDSGEDLARLSNDINNFDHYVFSVEKCQPYGSKFDPMLVDFKMLWLNEDYKNIKDGESWQDYVCKDDKNCLKVLYTKDTDYHKYVIFYLSTKFKDKYVYNYDSINERYNVYNALDY